MSEAEFSRPNYAGQELLSLFRGVIRVPAHRPTMREVVAMVAEKHGLTTERLLGPETAREVAWPRQEAMALIRKNTKFSLPQIGRYFGRDHTTVLHAIERVEQRRLAAIQSMEDACT